MTRDELAEDLVIQIVYCLFWPVMQVVRFFRWFYRWGSRDLRTRPPRP